MQNQEPIVITRRQVGHWAGVVGGIAFLIGLSGLLWGGIFNELVRVLLIGGLIGIILWIALSTREFIDVVTGRQTRYGTVSLLATFMLVGIIIMVYTFVQNRAITVDMTVNQQFTLSETTLEILRGVRRPIQITGFYSSAALAQREVDDQFFRLYETASDGMIRREYIDPDTQVALAERFGVTRDGMVFVSFLNDDGSVDFDSLARVPRGDSQERDMTQTLSRLLIAGTITVYFEVGHGERDPLDASQEGLSGINAGIQESGLVTFPLSLPQLVEQGEPIPDDAAALIMVRPVTQLSEAEVRLIDDYLNTGGSLFIMTDVLFSENPFLAQNSAFNDYLWDNFGIRALDMVVVDPVASFGTALDIIGAQVFTGIPIAERLDPAEFPVEFRLARALQVDMQTSRPDVANGRVVASTPQSYGETNLRLLAQANDFDFDEGQDLPGPLDTVVWATNQQTNARIVMVGDSDFVTNGRVVNGGNGILFTDALGWLTGFTERVQFAPQAFFTALPLIVLDNATINVIAFFAVVLMPAALVVIGMSIWLRRLRQ